MKLVGATSESEKLHFRILKRKDKLPVKSAYIDESTGKTVESEDIIKGFELDAGDFLHLEPDEIKALKLQSEHTLEVDGFIDEKTIDPLYLDKPYYLVPADKVANEAYAVFREALRKKGAAARSSCDVPLPSSVAALHPKHSIALKPSVNSWIPGHMVLLCDEQIDRTVHAPNPRAADKLRRKTT